MKVIDLCEILRALCRITGEYLDAPWTIDYLYSNDLVGIPEGASFWLIPQGQSEITIPGWKLLMSSSFISQIDEARIRCNVVGPLSICITFTDTSTYELTGAQSLIDAVRFWMEDGQKVRSTDLNKL